jgi:hypothetical protein
MICLTFSSTAAIGNLLCISSANSIAKTKSGCDSSGGNL